MYLRLVGESALPATPAGYARLAVAFGTDHPGNVVIMSFGIPEPPEPPAPPDPAPPDPGTPYPVPDPGTPYPVPDPQ